jgi:hypothetical protein
MPYELALDFNDLKLVVVHLGYDSWRPIVRKQLEFGFEIDGLIHVILATSPGAIND